MLYQPEMGRVFACQPTFSGGHHSSIRAFWHEPWAKDSPLVGQVTRGTGGNSLLAGNFNRFWVEAMNERDGWNMEDVRDQVNFFCMLHDDVTPEAGWLDVLMEELLASNADVIGAVIPIKDHFGITSTAIDEPKTRYATLRRLTMEEVMTLPETFTAADCGYPNNSLLVNTGCFLCRLDRQWAQYESGRNDGEMYVHFEINDRIVHRNGKWFNQTEPEDWKFSRDVQLLGGKVVATRKVKLLHWGELPFTNKEAGWGSCSYDEVNGHKFGNKMIDQKEEPAKPRESMTMGPWKIADNGMMVRDDDLLTLKGS